MASKPCVFCFPQLADLEKLAREALLWEEPECFTHCQSTEDGKHQIDVSEAITANDEGDEHIGLVFKCTHCGAIANHSIDENEVYWG